MTRDTGPSGRESRLDIDGDPSRATSLTFIYLVVTAGFITFAAALLPSPLAAIPAAIAAYGTSRGRAMYRFRAALIAGTPLISCDASGIAVAGTLVAAVSDVRKVRVESDDDGVVTGVRVHRHTGRSVLIDVQCALPSPNSAADALCQWISARL